MKTKAGSLIERIAIRHFLAYLFLCTSFVSDAQELDFLVGRIVMSFGDVYALDVNNANRQLVRRSIFYVGETIKTSDQSHAQLRMTDSGLIALRCQSTLKIEEYAYKQDEDDLITLRLIQGGVRTITGQIGQQSRDRYRFLAGESRVEIRGTDFEVRLGENGDAYFGVFDGGITVANAYGSVRLGIGENADFAIVEPGQAPRALRLPPQQLGSTSIMLPSGQQSNSGC